MTSQRTERYYYRDLISSIQPNIPLLWYLPNIHLQLLFLIKILIHFYSSRFPNSPRKSERDLGLVPQGKNSRQSFALASGDHVSFHTSTRHIHFITSPLLNAFTLNSITAHTYFRPPGNLTTAHYLLSSDKCWRSILHQPLSESLLLFIPFSLIYWTSSSTLSQTPFNPVLITTQPHPHHHSTPSSSHLNPILITTQRHS